VLGDIQSYDKHRFVALADPAGAPFIACEERVPE